MPAKVVVVPRVAELPTCQNTPHACPPLMNATRELLAVVSVVPIWKMKTELGSPKALSVSVPVNADFEGGFAVDADGVGANVSLVTTTGVAGVSIEDSSGDVANPLFDFDLIQF